MNESNVATFKPLKLKRLASEIENIVSRRDNDMWALGEKLTAARTICDDTVASAEEGVEGKTGNHRFNMWLSNASNLEELKTTTRARAMNLHHVFGRRRSTVKKWGTSILYELASPKNADVREQIIKANPDGLKALELRNVIKEMRGEKKATTNVIPMNSDDLMNQLAKALQMTVGNLREAAADMMHPDYMLAHSILEAEQVLIKRLANLSKPERRMVLSAVIEIAKCQQKTFKSFMKAKTPKYNQELQAKLKDEIKASQQATKKALNGQISIDDVGMNLMLRKDGKRFLQALHPDKHNGDETYVKLFQDFRAYMDKHGE